MQKLACFVACAFGRPDVEELYETYIEPLIRTERIRPLRVDRVVHNDDIDDKILELISECDFCIADLTYARPSVYYEAGRVQGLGKPVIFTTRSDHFTDKPDDPAGNLRVHFDLQMKNVIVWPDSNFKGKLSHRIRLITRPLLKDHELVSERARARNNFHRMSQAAQLKKINGLILDRIKSTGYEILTQGELFGPEFVLAIRKSPLGWHVVYSSARAAVSQRTFQWLNQLISYNDTILRYTGRHPQDVNVQFDAIICSLRPLTHKRIKASLGNFGQLDDSNRYYRKAELNGYTEEDHISFIQDIKSEEEFTDSFVRNLELIIKEQ